MCWLGSKFLVFTETHKLEVITSTFILHKKMMVQSKFLLKFHLTHSDAVPVILFVQKNSNPIELWSENCQIVHMRESGVHFCDEKQILSA